MFGVYSVFFTPSGTQFKCGTREHASIFEHVLSMVSLALASVSPDGEYVVAGSCDKKIRLWNWRKDNIMKQFVGHSADIHSLSPGSKDMTVNMTGREVTEPLEGHISSVISVHFSTDGSRIVSGSEDNTIRVWDADITIGKETKHTFARHISAVGCVAP